MTLNFQETNRFPLSLVISLSFKMSFTSDYYKVLTFQKCNTSPDRSFTRSSFLVFRSSGMYALQVSAHVVTIEMRTLIAR